MWWLFIIPSLRARKPSNEEKNALNWAFLLSPVVSLSLPVVTKDVALIWWMNAVAVVGCYIYAFFLKKDDDDGISPTDSEQKPLPPLLAQIYKALDYGSGQERGLRK
jgi:hypothetical protein